MTFHDVQGLALSGATAQALDPFEQANHELRCLIGDPLASAQRAIELAPQMTLAHALVGWLNLLGTEPAGIAAAREALQAARALPANEREAMHLQAIGQLVDGQWHAAGRTLEDLSIRWPHDTLALQAGHQIDFFTGSTRMLRDRIARALPAWQDEGRPARHAVLGMMAFGLEETADYARAERYGRRAVELERRDGWGWHAVTHVMEMQQRRADGIAWLRSDIGAWSDQSFFAVHNAWHLGLFHLGMDQIDETLALTDERILGGESPVVLDMIDASAMLWRLHLRGIDIGNRWEALADRWAPWADAGNYAFNDMHAMMAFANTGRDALVQQVLAAQQQALQQPGNNNDNATIFLREVGADATKAVLAFVQGRHADCVALLRPIRNRANRFGGSHAQRDLIDLTLIAAAERDGQKALADALRNERLPIY
ncbi:tetratricopeptide repeat protein [Piscinibacter sakaiensis]|uniref:tetratricopeptide repeat protein n=1 Tax=Piscinibacter sakaiensis TaxID=1547922 RepID=UPI003AABE45B